MTAEEKEKILETLSWLDSGDNILIAKELGVAKSTVSKHRNLKTKNINTRILYKALEMAESNRRKIMAKIQHQ